MFHETPPLSLFRAFLGRTGIYGGELMVPSSWSEKNFVVPLELFRGANCGVNLTRLFSLVRERSTKKKNKNKNKKKYRREEGGQLLLSRFLGHNTLVAPDSGSCIYIFERSIRLSENRHKSRTPLLFSTGVDVSIFWRKKIPRPFLPFVTWRALRRSASFQTKTSRS